MQDRVSSRPDLKAIEARGAEALSAHVPDVVRLVADTRALAAEVRRLQALLEPGARLALWEVGVEGAHSGTPIPSSLTILRGVASTAQDAARAGLTAVETRMDIQPLRSPEHSVVYVKKLFDIEWFAP